MSSMTCLKVKCNSKPREKRTHIKQNSSAVPSTSVKTNIKSEDIFLYDAVLLLYPSQQWKHSGDFLRIVQNQHIHDRGENPAT